MVMVETQKSFASRSLWDKVRNETWERVDSSLMAGSIVPDVTHGSAWIVYTTLVRGSMTWTLMFNIVSELELELELELRR